MYLWEKKSFQFCSLGNLEVLGVPISQQGGRSGQCFTEVGISCLDAATSVAPEFLCRNLLSLGWLMASYSKCRRDPENFSYKLGLSAFQMLMVYFI